MCLEGVFYRFAMARCSFLLRPNEDKMDTYV